MDHRFVIKGLRDELKKFALSNGLSETDIPTLDVNSADLESNIITNAVSAAWSRYASLGYLIMSAKATGLDKQTLDTLIDEMESQFNAHDLEYAVAVYMLRKSVSF